MAGRYLIKQRHAWAFRIAIPRAIRGPLFLSKNGKPLVHITRGLKTDSEKEAQAKADVLEREWKLVFERAKRGGALTPGEIEDIARDTYGSLLEAMATIPPGEGDLAGAIDAIENAIEDEEWRKPIAPCSARASRSRKIPLPMPRSRKPS